MEFEGAEEDNVMLRSDGSMSFRPLEEPERTKLMAALRGNAGGQAILMNPRDTSFEGVVDGAEEDETVIRAIKSVPCHY